ncbi:hypothetical protein WR25_19741 [Diploscapter pachys]|uniref:Uncharacterized protein n=1 Tax=Diploscapter pachys TaxID=2018661 RepID=A0A2A2KEX1_9BILA|nr:hypothetical protein WR25_19741 [Diploscapter pachys]
MKLTTSATCWSDSRQPKPGMLNVDGALAVAGRVAPSSTMWISEEGDDLRLVPTAQAVLVVAAQALGDPALKRCAAGQEGVAVVGIQCLFLHGDRPWRMTGAAMAQPFDQVEASKCWPKAFFPALIALGPMASAILPMRSTMKRFIFTSLSFQSKVMRSNGWP